MLAWQDIADDRKLDLTQSQGDDARSRASDARRGAIQSVRKTWSHLLSPFPSIEDPARLELDRSSVKATGQASIAEAAWQKAAEENVVLEILGRSSFVDRLRQLWPDDRNDLELDTVRDWFFEYPYMERLRDDQVLADAVSAAVADISDDGIGLAQGKREDGTYLGLEFQKTISPRFNAGAVLVRAAAAKAQMSAATEDNTKTGTGAKPGTHGRTSTGDEKGDSADTVSSPKRFVGVVELDSLRGLTKAGQVFESVITELDRAPGTKFRITLEIQAISDDGFTEDIEAVVRDNTETLGFDQKRFE